MLAQGQVGFIRGLLILGGARFDELSFRDKLDTVYARMMRDCSPEMGELVSQLADAGSEAEMDAIFANMRAVSMTSGREMDQYLAKKGVRRKKSLIDHDTIEEDFITNVLGRELDSPEAESTPES